MERTSKRLSIGLSLAVLLSLVVGVSSVAGGGPCCDVGVDFTADPTSGYAPLEVHFDDLSRCGAAPISFVGFDSLFRTLNLSAGDDWKQTWDFGDGATDQRHTCFSSSVDPFDVTHTYTQPGTYTVSLTYEFGGLCTSSMLPISLWNSSSSQKELLPTKTRELYITVLAPREEKKKDRPLEPAKMSVSYLNINATQVLPNQEVIVSANVCNQGEEDGTRTATLMVNGNAEQSQTVGVSGGSCKQVVFRVSRLVPGTYQVSVDGMQGQFSVLARRTVTNTVPSQQETGLGTAGILAIVIVGIVLIIALVVILKRE